VRGSLVGDDIGQDVSLQKFPMNFRRVPNSAIDFALALQ
jgi:hypothetical protein